MILNKRLKPFATERYRYKVASGGRGSGKSWGFADILLLKGASTPLRILCTREIQKSIRDSVHRLLKDRIAQNKELSDFYSVKEEYIAGKNGTRFFFCGLRHNANQIKSFEGIDIAWIEEAEKISKSSWEILTPTIRKKNSEIWLSYNPDLDEDFIHSKFSDPDKRPPNTLYTIINYNDNPWFPAVLEEERRHCLATDPELHEHIWEGRTRKHSQAQIFSGKWKVKEFGNPPADAMRYYGIDWGFGSNPCAFSLAWIEKNTLYVRVKHAWRADIEDVPDLIDAWDPEARNWYINADPEDPSSIRFVKNRGFRIRGAAKPPKSIEAGIRYLRSFDEIIFHIEDTDMHNEAKYYRYKVDPIMQDVTPIIIKANDHGWDSIRYALSRLILRGD